MTQNVIESWVDAVRNHLSPAADAQRDLPLRQAALDLGGETKNLRINLALQGGGAHGAFTWGVLEALLEDGRVGFEGLSGSSAGAMNAVLVAQGWLQGQTQEGPCGEREGARRVLADFSICSSAWWTSGVCARTARSNSLWAQPRPTPANCGCSASTR